MTTNFITTDGGLDEQAWAEMCAKASEEAVRGCGQSHGLFVERFSNAVRPHLEALPEQLQARAVELANMLGDYATPAELSAEQDWNAENGYCSHGIELNCCPAGCGDREAEFWFEPEDSWYRSATDELREIMDAEARATADTVHFALMASVQQLQAEGLDCVAVDLPVRGGVVHHTQLRLRPADAPSNLAPYTLDVTVDLSSTAKVTSSLEIPEAEADYWATELMSLDNVASTERLVGVFRTAAQAHFDAQRPRNPLLRLVRKLVDQFANPCQPASV